MLIPGGADSGRHSAASGRCRADPSSAVPLEGAGAYLGIPELPGHRVLTASPLGPDDGSTGS